ncbi:MAG TPA: hypothetical protein VGX03_09325 [Candidatus Binatia bacterium]|jgi:hypothetical protein|nr:hypothetical protein [Candidatus Binatia bacterium]
MDLVLISTLAQAVSAIGVIVSLVYLAVQVRQNTRAVRSSTHHALTVTRLDYIAMIAQSAELSRILRIGAYDLAKLDEEERYRFNLIMYYLFSAGENFYYQHQQGALDAEQWDRWCHALRYYFAQPGIRAWFATSPLQFAASFAEFLEREFRLLSAAGGER